MGTTPVRCAKFVSNFSKIIDDKRACEHGVYTALTGAMDRVGIAQGDNTAIHITTKLELDASE